MSASMKSEERHRLNTNELGQTVQVVGHRLEEHATKIVMAVCGVLVVAAALIWWSRQSNSSSQLAWTKLESAQNVNDFGEVAETFKGTLAGSWAKLRESELNLQSGLAAMLTDREVALTDLKKAQKGFEVLTDGKRVEPAILERALWGLALTLEATSDSDTSKAGDVYQRLLNDVPETYYKPVAEQRIAALKTGGTKEFYAWFSKQNPKPTESRPKDGSAADPFESMLPGPGKSEFSLEPNPPKSQGGKPGGTESDGTKPDDGKPGDPATKAKDPAPEKPAQDKPDEPITPQVKPEETPAPKDGAAKPEKKPETEPNPEKDSDKKD
jgi:hypothetical protein